MTTHEPRFPSQERTRSWQRIWPGTRRLCIGCAWLVLCGSEPLRGCFLCDSPTANSQTRAE